ncbi:MAG: class I SAM-dependent methyltransferase [Planctomycetes bacterium]|nr:class I SAM-dependent methyltransferase [Planctomycetota bacterium]
MRWWLKAGVARCLAWLPAGEAIHFWLQRRFGELRHLEQSTRFDNAEYFLRTTRAHAGYVHGLRVVELGTGWVPAVPLAYAVAGALVATYDVRRLVRDDLFARTRDEIGRRAEKLAAAAGQSPARFCARLARIAKETQFDRALRRLGGLYRAPWNTCRLPYKDNAVDLVVSNLVLQCVHRALLPPLLEEMRRVLKPGGLSIHRASLTCEYAAGDPRRHPLSYLKYSDATWNRWFNHSIKYVNRLRYSQFLQLFEEAGFEIAEVRPAVDYDAIPHLKELGVADEFRGFSWEDLATTGFEIVLKKPAAVPSSTAYLQPVAVNAD